MKKVLWIVGGLIGLLIVVAVAAPFFIDLNNYKAEIAAQAKKATGRDLAIDGDISLSILPTPGVTVSGVRFGNVPGGSVPDMATLESATVKVALMPLLSGNVEVESVVLDKPTFIFEKLADGSGNWQIAPEAEAPEAGVTPAPSQAPAEGGGMAVVIKSASIEGGTLIYRDIAKGTEQKVENLNIDLALDSLSGPFQAEGGATVVNIPLGFRIKTGVLDLAKPMPLELAFSLTDANAEIGFTGQVNAAGAENPDTPIVTGKLTGKGDSVAKLLAALPGGGSADGLPPLLSQAFSLDGDVQAGVAAAKVENFTLAMGDLTANAGVNATYQGPVAVNAKLAIGRLDLDQLMPPAGAKTEAAAPATTNAPPPAPASFSLPADVTANAEVTIQQIAYQGQAIDDTKVVAELTGAELNIKSASAKLPGGSSVNLSGALTAQGGKPNFAGALKADSTNLRELIEAFAPGAVQDVPADRLRQLSLTTRVGYNPAQVELGDLSATLDQSKLSGGVVVALPDGVQRKQLGLGVGISIDKLNLDGYMPVADAAKAEPAAAAEQKAAGGNPLTALAPLADYSANVDLRAGALTLNQQQISGLRLVASVAGGALDVKELSVKDFQGGKANIAAKVTDLKGDPKFAANFDITAKDAGRVLQMAGMPAEKGKLGALSLKGTASGTPTDVAYDVNAGMAGIGFQGAAKGTANGIGAGIPKINSTFDIKAKDLGPIAALAGMPADAAKQVGAVSFSGQAQSGADDLTFDIALSLAGVGGKGALKGNVAGLSGTPQIDTILNLTADKPAPLLRLAGIAGPKAQSVGKLGIAGTLKGSAENMDLDLNLDGLGGKAKVAGNVQMPKEKPIAFNVALQADHPEFTQLLKMADMQSAGVTAGPLKASLKAQGSTEKASVSDLNATWGNSSISGNADYDATGAKPFVKANLKGGVINLTPFMGGGGGGEAASGGGGGG